MSPGHEMLCDIQLRKTWFEDAKALFKAEYGNPFYDTEHDEETLAFAADGVIICGDAAEEAAELGNDDLSQLLYDIACEALKAYLAILWGIALPEDMGGSKDIDHPEHRGDLAFHELGMDTKSKRQWLDTKRLDKDATALMAACTNWWEHMWDEIEDMAQRRELEA